MHRCLTTLLLLSTLFSCKSKTVFERVDSGTSGIYFNNKIEDNDSLNILDVENLYNGGGVGIGDFNNDGLQDIYFTANAVANKLYLNKGKFRFDDITQKAGVNGEGRWCRGVSVVDINNDGLQDIYLSASLSADVAKRQNILYVNEGLNKEGIPVFKDKAAEYGLADTVHSTMAAFFDYDNDGDLDMYLVVNEILKTQYPGSFKPVLTNREHPNTDKLFRNDWDSALNHPRFTDISSEAGITIEGFGHGVTIADINLDGWKDIYVTNDFISNNLSYINNKDGRFTNEATTYFKHTSESSMGQDIIDINNDGLADVIELDMNPEDNYRKKMMMGALSYQRYQNNEYYGYQYQYVRNVLQLNGGPRVLQNDSVGPPVFSDVAFYAGIAETDWSWTPSVADFDNDGNRDLIITNGFPKDVTDHDFTTFRSKANNLASKRDILDQIPQVKISNYAYKNNGDVKFKDVTDEWGLRLPSFSNGAAYVDLDNDGDLDYVVNNINDEAFLYQNHSRELHENQNFLAVKFSGDSLNKNGLGAILELHYNGKQQVYENTPYRGYLSSITPVAHFGLDTIQNVDSVLIKWPGGRMQLLQNVKPNQMLTVNVADAQLNFSFENKNRLPALFSDVTKSLGVALINKERDFIDFNIQKLLPHKLSEYGPALAVGDIDGNGLDDLVSGGASKFDASLFFQQTDGTFKSRPLLNGPDSLPGKLSEDMGVLLFDADGDKDLDLYFASGGYEFEPNTGAYSDRLYINDGKGMFERDSVALPDNNRSKSCVRAADFDKDGDLDLFVGGRVDPWNYPKPVSSFIYRNDSRNGIIKFTNITTDVAPALLNLGMACDAVWTDFDNDGWLDLVVTGEWMPVRFLKNKGGKFSDVTQTTGISNKIGWWNSIVPGDFDNDGDIDYIAGNLGLNSFYRASEDYPVNMYAKDFNSDGNFDAFTSVYLPFSQVDKTLTEVPASLREDAVKQIIGMRSKFQNYKSYAVATFDQLFTEDELKSALKLQANYFSHSLLRNMGNGKFELIPLPAATQYSCVNGIVTEDFDGDGNLDLAISGNDYGTEVATGRYDACNGLYLKGDGKASFNRLSILEAGLYIPGNGKALVTFRNAMGNCMIGASQNRGPYKFFRLNNAPRSIALNPLDVYALIQYKNGSVQKREFNYGSSFLSQSGRFLLANPNVAAIEIVDSQGQKRKQSF